MATTNDASDIVPETITISEQSDLTVKVIEYTLQREVDPVTKKKGFTKSMQASKIALFKVDKNKMIKESVYFKRMLGIHWSVAGKDIVELREDTIMSMEIWFRLFHSNIPPLPLDSIPISEVWYTVMASDKYEISPKRAAAWFQKWYSAHEKEILDDKDFCREVLFPCYMFDDIKGFQTVTKYLAYNYPFHITEKNPTLLHQMHLPRRIMHQLNAARGRLRVLLHRDLFAYTKRIVDDAKCSCKEGTVFQYLRELRRIKAWPLEDEMSKTSVQEILNRLVNFDEKRMRSRSTPVPGSDAPAPPHTVPDCFYCKRNFENIVNLTRQTVANYFDGLCIDCLTIKNPVRTIAYVDVNGKTRYFPEEKYDARCRISHGEPTWYFSTNGRKEKAGQFEREYQAK